MEKKLNCVLLIDDDFATNFINKKIVQKSNIAEHIQVALNGKEAIDYLCSKGEFESQHEINPQPDLIFLDINMPVMDGWEFIKKYKNLISEDRKKKISIIMLTSSFNPADKAKADTIKEIADYRQKTLSGTMLEEIVKKHFEKYSE
ncbi:response regulator [Flavobacterium hibisci]|uniref:response regulator n=1 Tax=Flavobacterium hibisci TaxID=1914462 RepID=UPI001CBD996B|nr:response regulator [Flavobacterium hibisci]MBZ4040831.1 response regulator [Flavobacterium hibisci]